MLQKAGIEVNEKGTLAFAATGMRATSTNTDNLLNLTTNLLLACANDGSSKSTLSVSIFFLLEIQLVNKFGIDEMPIQFEANRPFMFYIKDQDSDAVLFVGKVENPVSMEKTSSSA